MKKEMTLSATSGIQKLITDKITNGNRALSACKPLVILSAIYSALLEEKITPQFTLKLIHAQVAVACFLAFCGSSFLIHLLLLAWAGLSVYRCRTR